MSEASGDAQRETSARPVPVLHWPFGRRLHHAVTPVDVHREAVSAELFALAALPNVAVLERLESRETGLSEEESAERRARFGLNQVAHEGHESFTVQLARRLANPLNVLLCVLALVSVTMGDAEAASIILVMVVLSVTLALAQERRSSRAAARLKAMVHTTATVLRTAVPAGVADAPTCERPIEELVPGDVVHLSACLLYTSPSPRDS